MPSNKFFNKLPISNSSAIQETILNSNWSKDLIKLNFIKLDETNQVLRQWTAQVAHSEMAESAAELELEYNDFYGQCRKALTTNGGTNEFRYSLDETADTFTLVYINFKINIIYLNIDLVPADSTLCTFVADVIEIITYLQGCDEMNKSEITKCREAYVDTLESFNKCVEKSKAQELELLQKCALLLNTKKDKIAQLEELLAERESYAVEKPTSSIEEKHSQSTDAKTSETESFDFEACTQQLATAPVIRKRRKFDDFDIQPSTSAATLLLQQLPPAIESTSQPSSQSSTDNTQLFNEM